MEHSKEREGKYKKDLVTNNVVTVYWKLRIASFRFGICSGDLLESLVSDFILGEYIIGVCFVGAFVI